MKTNLRSGAEGALLPKREKRVEAVENRN